MNIIDFIPKGRKNAVTTEELKIRTGLDIRSIRKCIANARLKGAVICSSLKSDSAEINAVIAAAEGWERRKQPMRFGYAGVQKGFVNAANNRANVCNQGG